MENQSQSRLLYLISGYNAGRLNYGERSELQAWANGSEQSQALFNQLTDQKALAAEVEQWNASETELALISVKSHIKRNRRVQRNWITWAAVFVIGMLTYAHYQLFFKTSLLNEHSVDQVYHIAEKIQPGSNKATLTLAGGQVLDLSQMKAGAITQQSGINITKTADGQLVYEVEPNNYSHNISPALNTITTPKGGQYQVRLPDGSKVWLNAASTLRYQANMSLAQPRIVELSGEAYFEVAPVFASAKSSKQIKQRLPFIVRTQNQQVQVLGTHFNVSSYADEANTTTTLLEGKVRVSSMAAAKETQVLEPGQQAVYHKQKLSVSPADTELATAWKNGEIRFKNAPLHEILKQAARWYNIEIEYTGALPDERLSGAISRSDKLDVLLRILELQGLTFEMQQTTAGYKLIVLDK